MTDITIDGEPITLQNTHHGVDTLLTAAGLDWRKYDLLRVEVTGDTTTYVAGDTLDVHDGDEFVSAAVSTSNG